MKSIPFLLAISTLCVFAEASTIAQRDSIRVKKGQTIQSVLDAAPEYSRIVVPKGQYYENLKIEKNGITLAGEAGAEILPPTSTYIDTVCAGVVQENTLDEPTTQAGICVQGRGVVLGPADAFGHFVVATVESYVQDVTVTGLKVTGFQTDILVIGARNTRVVDNVLVDGIYNGIFTLGSYDTVLRGNVLRSALPYNIFFGYAIKLDNVAGARATDNIINGYLMGVLVLMPGAVVKDNKITGACYGAYIGNGGGSEGTKVVDNTISHPLPCLDGFVQLGVVMDGGNNIEVRDNKISDYNDLNTGVGVIFFGGTGNIVAGNVFRNNNYNVQDFGGGVLLTVKNNVCKNTQPDDVCK